MLELKNNLFTIIFKEYFKMIKLMKGDMISIQIHGYHTRFSIMKVKKTLSWVAISLGVISLVVLLIVNVNTAYSNSNQSQEELAFKDKAVEIMNIDTDKAKPAYMLDVYDDSNSEFSSDIRYKCVHALTLLSMDGTHKNGDFMPVFFIEGNDKVSIAFKHDDGTITLDEFDISGKNPIKTNQIVKEAE